jgi:hypothetical protein
MTKNKMRTYRNFSDKKIQKIDIWEILHNLLYSHPKTILETILKTPTSFPSLITSIIS